MGKRGRCVRLTSPPSCGECHEIWEPKPPGTLWATPGLLRDSFTFTFTKTLKFPGYYKIINSHHHAVCILPVFVTNTSVPARFRHQQLLHLLSLLTEAFLLIYHGDTRDLIQPHRKISNAMKSGDRGGQSFFPINRLS